jgi:hypothetical protein
MRVDTGGSYQAINLLEDILSDREPLLFTRGHLESVDERADTLDRFLRYRLGLWWRHLGRLALNGDRADLALLHDMGEFVGEQLASGLAVWCVATSAEGDVLANRERVSAESSGRTARLAIVVDTHCAEVVAESRLEVLARISIEGMAGRIYDTAVDWQASRVRRIMPHTRQNTS